jgi:formate hydrogenlyase subunit 4
MKTIIFLLQFTLIVVLAPLVSGVISKIKNNLRMRAGAGVLQPYYNLKKLFFKGEIISDSTSWIFRAAPFVVLSSTLTAILLVPAVIAGNPAGFAGEFLAIIFLLGLGRFFLALAGLDAGSSFGGMGSSREMFISSLAEPAACLAIFALFLQSGSTNPACLGGAGSLRLGTVFAGLSLFMVIIAESSRLPVDNQETHLELTMIHEAMILEYSGRSLAFIEFAAYLKQLLWFMLLACIIYPAAVDYSAGFTPIFYGILFFGVKIFLIAGAMGILEVLIAKMRLLRVADYFAFAIVLGILAIVAAIMGI